MDLQLDLKVVYLALSSKVVRLASDSRVVHLRLGSRALRKEAKKHRRRIMSLTSKESQLYPGKREPDGCSHLNPALVSGPNCPMPGIFMA